MKGEIVSNTTNEGRYSKKELEDMFFKCGLILHEPGCKNASTDSLVQKIVDHDLPDNSFGSGSYCNTILNFLTRVINLPNNYRVKEFQYSDA